MRRPLLPTLAAAAALSTGVVDSFAPHHQAASCPALSSRPQHPSPSHHDGDGTALPSMVSDEEAATLLADFYDLADEELPPQNAQQQQPIRRFKRPKKVPLIAVVGRPNVGKSALVNRLAGTQSGGAIVADEEGITRDRTYRNADFLGEAFQLVDTGGLVFDDTDALFAKEIREQAMIAIEESAGVILVVDGQVGPTAMDEQLATFLRKEVTKKMPVLLAVNKCESDKNGAYLAAQFWNLGLGEPRPVSALHGVGTADLLEGLFEGIVDKGSAIQGFGTKVKEMEAAQQALMALDKGDPLEGEDETDVFLRQYGVGRDSEEVIQRYEEAMSAFDDVPSMEEINVAIVGRPNVGKSSLLNTIFGSNRAIRRCRNDPRFDRRYYGAPVLGPRRDAHNLPLRGHRRIRRKGKVEFGPEFFMVNRALRAIRRADVVLLVLDATAGVTEQDRVLAQKISDDGRACVIVCNKWDAVIDKDSSTYDQSVKYFREELPQVRWAPILFVSAATGQRCGKIYDAVDSAVKAHRRRISTSVLNEVLRDAVLNGAQAKIYYGSQVSTRPPTIVVFVNDPKLVNDNYRRYLDRKMRESLDGFESTPIRWMFRGRRVRDVTRNMNGAPGQETGTSFPFPHAI
ncbi:LOW QUALITY PROTEIN: hypothetical protein ACHAXT_001191 [Thalassiosira profunda]